MLNLAEEAAGISAQDYRSYAIYDPKMTIVGCRLNNGLQISRAAIWWIRLPLQFLVVIDERFICPIIELKMIYGVPFQEKPLVPGPGQIDFINFAALEVHILSKLRIMQIDLFAKCRSAEVCRTQEAAIAEICIACEIRAAEISKSLEIAGCEVGSLAKWGITECGINPEIGFFEFYSGRKMAVSKFG